jgi:hypothetical protein
VALIRRGHRLRAAGRGLGGSGGGSSRVRRDRRLAEIREHRQHEQHQDDDREHERHQDLLVRPLAPLVARDDVVEPAHVAPL